MLRKLHTSLLAVPLLFLAACGGSGDTGGGTQFGTIAGQVSFSSGGFDNAALLESWAGTPFVPGELLVGFSDEASLVAQSTSLETAGLSVQFVRTLGGTGGNAPSMFANPGLDDAALLELAAGLADQPGIAWVHPNYLLTQQLQPNDPVYEAQWHYASINLPAAWDLATGNSSTVVAVIDSGILHAAGQPQWTHPDFGANILPGYDFVSSVQSSLDGDGRDADPFDPGDTPGGQSTYHGSHVAGTIAALSNDGVGAAGVNWKAKLLPVRVLGAGGSGSMADIYEGMLWAAGFSWEGMGIPVNPNPANVLNMSLGGQGACLPVVQQAITAVVEAGSLIVVAAGNDNIDVSGVTPAGCQDVITVGATDFRDFRASYSNYGSGVHIMAPGGDTSVDLNGDGYADGVLSAGHDDYAGEFTFTFKDGTSMAAPHIAGVVSLILGVAPNLTRDQVLQILQETAMPLPAGACAPGMCGAGLVDAAAAVQAAMGSGPGPVDPGPGDPGPTDPWNPDPVDPGPGGPDPASPQGPMIVGSFQEGDDGQPRLTGSQSGSAPFTLFSFEAETGTSWVEAWTDENRNGNVDQGDYLGSYPFPVNVRAGSGQTGVDIVMNRVTGTTVVPVAVARALEAAAR